MDESYKKRMSNWTNQSEEVRNEMLDRLFPKKDVNPIMQLGHVVYTTGYDEPFERLTGLSPLRFLFSKDYDKSLHMETAGNMHHFSGIGKDGIPERQRAYIASLPKLGEIYPRDTNPGTPYNDAKNYIGGYEYIQNLPERIREDPAQLEQTVNDYASNSTLYQYVKDYMHGRGDKARADARGNIDGVLGAYRDIEEGVPMPQLLDDYVKLGKIYANDKYPHDGF